MSDAQLQVALDKANVPSETSAAIVDENAKARIESLRVCAGRVGLPRCPVPVLYTAHPQGTAKRHTDDGNCAG